MEGTVKKYKKYIGILVLVNIIPCILGAIDPNEKIRKSFIEGYIFGWECLIGIACLIGFIAFIIWCFDEFDADDNGY